MNETTELAPGPLPGSWPPWAAARATAVAVDQDSPASAKIALFRSLFRGRAEVYPRRFESRITGRSGYQPAWGNEWVKGICEKPRIKCSDCPNQRFLAVTDETVRWHLSGVDDRGLPFVMGVYPMLLDETCWFLAADFDGVHWQDDTGAFLATCRRLGVPAALERSRSGDGGHVWIFFAQPVPATLARKLGAHVLTETMERRPEVGLRSYDRFFPNQDTLPRGGFGNLIALPLQRRARDLQNSLFVDDSFTAVADQWAFLSGIERIQRQALDRIVREAEGRDRIVGVKLAPLGDDDDPEPWMAQPSRRHPRALAGPMPGRVELVLSDQIYIAKGSLPPSLRNALIRLAAFQNPEFHRAQAMRLPTYDKPRIIACAEDQPRHLGLPRGCLAEVIELLAALNIEPVIRDERCGGAPIDASFTGTLQPDQQSAAGAMLAHDTGVLAATTAFGKTVVAAWLIAQRGVNTLVLVHRQQLLEQWIARLSQFLDLPAGSIGRWGGGRKKPTGRVDVALMQSLVRKGEVNDLVAGYGHLVVDECHHLSAHSFELVARRTKARFVTGLSATVARKDGHHPVIFMQCGPVRHRVDARRQAAQRPFSHHVLVRPTGFISGGDQEPDPRLEFQRLCAALVLSESRNRQICEDVLAAVGAGRSPIILTERTGHLIVFEGLLRPCVPNLITLQGGMGRKALRTALARGMAVPCDEPRVILATGRFVGEGFDDPRLDTLFLAMPVSWRGTIAQYAGRLHRIHAGKREVQIHDYADLDVPMFSRMFERRCAGYQAQGYSVLLPASALPGWPASVPLPVDPRWKSDYAASVRRLIRDGVDQPLAAMFAHTAREPASDADGIDRARSASEAFLFRRLESLPALAGRFRLNAHLPIPFDDQGRMEVDFLCRDARLVLEIDGGQHLGDADAWRRDRRKDAALQAHGFFVLRFLAEDLGKRLDMVLDTVLRTLAGRDSQAQAVLSPR